VPFISTPRFVAVASWLVAVLIALTLTVTLTAVLSAGTSVGAQNATRSSPTSNGPYATAQRLGQRSTPQVALANFVAEGGPIPQYMGNIHQGEGSFRTGCEAGQLLHDDPIVHPGKPGAAHLHQFFGNLSIDAYSDSDSILNTGNSTCDGGPINRTGYWVPAMLNPSRNQVVVMDHAIVYYKEEPGNNPQPLPPGLRMLAGFDMGAMAPGSNTASYTCVDTGVSSGQLPSCTSGQIRMTLEFPHCWDGVNHDSANHRSHMSNHVYVNGARACPGTHPVKIPRITYNVYYSVKPGENANQWKLSSDGAMAGGTSMHGDWWGGWNTTYSQRWFDNCIVAWRNCNPGQPGSELGDGGRLVNPAPSPYGPRGARVPIPPH
jgi:hypothetical protein